MKFLKSLKLVGIALISLLFAILLGGHLLAVNPSLDKPDLDRLYQPRAYQCDALPSLADIESAYNSIEGVSNNQPMRIPLPSKNPREKLVAEATIDPSTGKEVPITAGQTRNMYTREATIRQRNCQPGFSLEQKKQSRLLASMDFTNLAQYEGCVFVDAFGTVRDGCFIDLVVRDYNSGRRWKYPAIYIDKFCVDVMRSHRNGTWF